MVRSDSIPTVPSLRDDEIRAVVERLQANLRRAFPVRNAAPSQGGQVQDAVTRLPED